MTNNFINEQILRKFQISIIIQAISSFFSVTYSLLYFWLYENWGVKYFSIFYVVVIFNVLYLIITRKNLKKDKPSIPVLSNAMPILGNLATIGFGILIVLITFWNEVPVLFTIFAFFSCLVSLVGFGVYLTFLIQLFRNHGTISPTDEKSKTNSNKLRTISFILILSSILVGIYIFIFGRIGDFVTERGISPEFLYYRAKLYFLIPVILNIIGFILVDQQRNIRTQFSKIPEIYLKIGIGLVNLVNSIFISLFYRYGIFISLVIPLIFMLFSSQEDFRQLSQHIESFSEELLRIAKDHNVISLNELALRNHLEPKKGFSITQKYINRGLLIGWIDRHTWEFHIGREAFEQHTNQTTSSYPQPSSMQGKPKDRLTAGVLAILLGDLGVHQFYLGNTAMGIVMILFCWTGIPAIIGIIQGILYLTKTDEEFQIRYVKSGFTQRNQPPIKSSPQTTPGHPIQHPSPKTSYQKADQIPTTILGSEKVSNSADFDFCPFCGIPLGDGFDFCPKCGKKLPIA